MPEPDNETTATTEDVLHGCGMPACLGGWIAVSPEFQADGGTVCQYGEFEGSPQYLDYNGPEALAAWMDIDIEDAEALTALRGKHLLYPGLKVGDITPGDVIEALEILRDRYARPA